METRHRGCQLPKSQDIEILVPYIEPARVTDKWCPQCRQWKNLSDFYADASQWNGVCSVCKKCDNSNRAQRASKNSYNL